MYGVYAALVFIEIYKEIRFYQNAVIQPIHLGIGMVVRYQITDAFYNVVGDIVARQHTTCQRRALYLLILPGAAMILSEAGVDADIVYQGGKLECKQRFFCPI